MGDRSWGYADLTINLLFMKFEDLLAWQEARQLVQAIYKLTAIEKLNKDFGLINQIQRSTVSIMSNIAEGFERKSLKEKNQFYNIARASCGETRSLLYVIMDNYPHGKELCEGIMNQINETGRMVTGLIKSTNNRILQ